MIEYQTYLLQDQKIRRSNERREERKEEKQQLNVHIHGTGYTSNDRLDSTIAEQGSVELDFTMYGFSCYEHTLRNMQGDTRAASSHDDG